MKKFLVLLALAACAAGCRRRGEAAKGLEARHAVQDADHMRFSWGGYKDVSMEDQREVRQTKGGGRGSSPPKPARVNRSGRRETPGKGSSPMKRLLVFSAPPQSR